MRVVVVGLGYVGLVTGACLAEWGHDVVGVEADEDRLANLRLGRIPIHEPGLDQMVGRHAAGGRLHFAPVTPSAFSAAHLVIIAVGTHDGDGGWQTTSLAASLADVVPHMADDAALVVRSTLPPTFIRQLPGIVDHLRREAGRPALAVLVNPEFTREGSAISDFMKPDRIVIGVAEDPTGRGVGRLRGLYRRTDAPILVLSAADAILAKIGSNLFLATKISFANELAAICDAFGGTVDQVVQAMSFDPRIGGSFLRAGVGFGGSCLPHQVVMTMRIAASAGMATPLLAAVSAINRRQQKQFVRRIAGGLGGQLAGRRVALLGLTFKPGTDDLREAPSLAIAALLLRRRATVVAYDPMERARHRAASMVPGLVTVASVEEALAGADAVGLVTEWPEFDQIDWVAARRVMRGTFVVDGRNALDPARVAAAGITYTAFGRGRWEASGELAPAEEAAGRMRPEPEAAGSITFAPALSGE